jgi:hypothetical protein
MTTTLASSAGWSWNPPSWNHAWVPRFSLPSDDTTSISSAIAAT